MKYVLIDTNIYEKAAVNFKSTSLAKIAQLCQASKIKLLYSAVIEEELKKHIQEDIRVLINKLCQAEKKGSAIAQHALKEADIGFKSKQKELKKTLINNRISELSEYLNTLTNAHKLTFSDIDPEVIFKDYFEKKSPFEDGKKEEFPDAFILASLKKYCSNNLSDTCVISNDMGWTGFIQTHMPDATLYSSLSGFLDFMIENESAEKARAEKLEQYFTENGQKLIEYITSDFADSSENFYLDDSWVEPEFELDSETIKVKILGVNFIDVTDEGATLNVDANIKFDVHVSSSDPDSMYRDPDTRDFHYVHSMESLFKVTKDVEFEIDVSFDEDSISSTLEFEDIQYNQDLFNLFDEPFEEITSHHIDDFDI